MYSSKIKIIFFLGNTNHSILFIYILVIVCANLTSNTVILKRLSKGFQIYKSLLIDFCNDYRPYLCWQVSCILFSIIILSFDFNLSESLISRSKKSPATMRPAYVWHNWTAYLSHKKVDLHSLLNLICPSMTINISSLFIYSIVHVGWLAYHLWRNIPSGRAAWNTKEIAHFGKQW